MEVQSFVYNKSIIARPITKNTLKEALLHITIAQSIFTGCILLTKSEVRITDKLLSAWMFLLGIAFSIKLFLIVFPENPLESSIISGAISLLFPSLLYLYTKYASNNADKLMLADYKHMIPFILILLPIGYFIFNNPSSLYQNFFIEIETPIFFVVFGLTYLVTYIFYGVRTIRLVDAYQALENDYYADHPDSIDLNWMKKLVIAFYVFAFTVVIYGSVAVFGKIILFEQGTLNLVGFMIFIYVLSFKAYKQSASIIRQEIVEKTAVAEENKLSPRYEKSSLKDEEAKQYIDQLLEYMETIKPWKESDLNIQKLSLRTGIPQRFITQTLNEYLEKNFYTFVNEYRIKEVIRLFQSEKHHQYTILAIAYECGFNSKSSFNAFFKKYTGKTPSQFRKELKS